jgi:hypothetical protein
MLWRKENSLVFLGNATIFLVPLARTIVTILAKLIPTYKLKVSLVVRDKILH